LCTGSIRVFAGTAAYRDKKVVGVFVFHFSSRKVRCVQTEFTRQGIARNFPGVEIKGTGRIFAGNLSGASSTLLSSSNSGAFLSRLLVHLFVNRSLGVKTEDFQIPVVWKKHFLWGERFLPVRLNLLACRLRRVTELSAQSTTLHSREVTFASSRGARVTEPQTATSCHPRAAYCGNDAAEHGGDFEAKRPQPALHLSVAGGDRGAAADQLNNKNAKRTHQPTSPCRWPSEQG
jgi:hypothetical protein